jgi:hypothetical protein
MFARKKGSIKRGSTSCEATGIGKLSLRKRRFLL